MEPFNFHSVAVHSHLGMLQNVIQRMAENSRNCKLWCVTTLSAIIFFAAREDKPDLILLALIPLALFSFLDTYYLSLEQRFRSTYDQLLGRINRGEYGPDNAFQIKPADWCWQVLSRSISSSSIWLFYLVASGAIVAVLLYYRIWGS